MSHWPLDDDAATTADNYGSNTLSENGSVTRVAGQVGSYAHEFDSDGDYWSITDASQSGLDITGDLTITAWIKGNNWQNRNSQICGKEDDAYVFRVNSNKKLDIVVNNTTATEGVGIIPDLTATHVAVVLDTVADTVKYYINGQLDQTVSSFTATPADTANAFCIAYGSINYNYFGGSGNTVNFIDDVSIWSRTLNGDEINSIYLYGVAGATGI